MQKPPSGPPGAPPGQIPPRSSRPPSNTVVCPIHNLRYSPQQAEGCVLCRRAAAPPVDIEPAPTAVYIPTSLIVLVLSAAVGTGAYYALRPKPTAENLVPAAAMLWGSESNYARCGSTCAEAHHKCDGQCSERGGDDGCSQYCLTEVDKCFIDCIGRFQKRDHAWSYYYGSETMPDWSELLVGSVDLGPRLMACSDEPIVALAYVKVSGRTEQTNEARVGRGKLTAEVAACVNAALVEAPFAASPLGDYSFLARFDSRHDRLKLAVEQASAELDAAPRKTPKPLEDAITERLFEARVALSKESEEELRALDLPPANALLQ
jgi:hypothetical protein